MCTFGNLLIMWLQYLRYFYRGDTPKICSVTMMFTKTVVKFSKLQVISVSIYLPDNERPGRLVRIKFEETLL